MVTDAGHGGDEGVSTTKTSFEILDALKKSEGLTITGLTERTGLTKSTVYRHLQTLKELGYVVEREGGHYIGFRLLEISERARNRRRGYTVCRDKVFELAQTTDERALFLVEERGEGVYIHRAGGVSDTMIGKRRPLHALASGKAILAEWSDDDVETFVDEQELPRLTDNTITDRDALSDELETIRERGYAVNEEEHMDGLRAVAVPVFDADDALLGSLSVFGPQSRFGNDYVHEGLPSLLRDKADEVKVDLAYE